MNNPTEDNNKDEKYNPFNLEALRIDQSYLECPVAKKLLTTVPTRKPHKQDFIRVHPRPEYRLPVALVELHDEREFFLVTPQVMRELGDDEFFLATLYLVISRQKVVSIWPVKLPKPDGRKMDWHISAATAAERAMHKWIKVVANMSLGANEITEASHDFGEPEWPELSFEEIITIAFRGRLIDTVDHLVIKKLRGLA